MCAGVAVTADDGHPRLSQSLFRADDVHDALSAVIKIKQRYAKVPAVFFDGRHHLLGKSVGEGPRLIVGGDDVVDRGKRPIWIRNGQLTIAQHLKGLRAGHFVDQVQPNEQLRLPIGQRPHGMEVPDLVE